MSVVISFKALYLNTLLETGWVTQTRSYEYKWTWSQEFIISPKQSPSHRFLGQGMYPEFFSCRAVLDAPLDTYWAECFPSCHLQKEMFLLTQHKWWFSRDHLQQCNSKWWREKLIPKIKILLGLDCSTAFHGYHKPSIATENPVRSVAPLSTEFAKKNHHQKACWGCRSPRLHTGKYLHIKA